MPYIKPTKKPFEKMRRLLLGYELTPTTLSKILGCCYNTAKDRIDNPGHLTVEDLDRIRRFGHVPIEEIKEAAFLN